MNLYVLCVVLILDIEIVDAMKSSYYRVKPARNQTFNNNLVLDENMNTCLDTGNKPGTLDNPWLRIILDRIYDIAKLILFHNNYVENLRFSTKIHVSNDSNNYRTFAVNIRITIKGGYFNIPFQSGSIGQMITLTEISRIIMCELQVFVDLKSVNLAFKMPIVQSDVIPFDHAGLANDGDEHTCVLLKSKLYQDTWINVKLDNIYYVTHVNIIYKRIDQESHVFVSNDASNHKDHWCAQTRNPSAEQRIHQMLLKCSKPISGRYVILRYLKHSLDQYIVICELEVYARESSQETDVTSISCLPQEHKCEEGGCISRNWLCDGVRDCPYSDDENRSCVMDMKYEFKCKRKIVKLPIKHRCDGVWHCSDYSDEEQCVDITLKPMKTTFKGVSTFYICSEGWIDRYSVAICQEYDQDFVNTTKTFRYDVSSDHIITVNTTILNDQIERSLTSLWSNSGTCEYSTFVGINCAPKKSLLNLCGESGFSDSFYEPFIPWNVKIMVYKFFHETACFGSIINYRWILTAAHCFDSNQNIKEIFVQVGLNFDDDTYMKTYGVTHLVLHPEYSSDEYKMDIALLRLDERVTSSRLIKQICLPVKTIDWRSLMTFKRCLLTAFVTNEKENNRPMYMIHKRVDVFEDNSCVLIYNNKKDKSTPNLSINDLMINKLMCAGRIPLPEDEKICYAKSGGSLTCEDNDGKWTHVGIASFGPGKRDNKSCTNGFFLRVDPFMDFIKTTTTKFSF